MLQRLKHYILKRKLLFALCFLSAAGGIAGFVLTGQLLWLLLLVGGILMPGFNFLYQSRQPSIQETVADSSSASAATLRNPNNPSPELTRQASADPQPPTAYQERIHSQPPKSEKTSWKDQAVSWLTRGAQSLYHSLSNWGSSDKQQQTLIRKSEIENMLKEMATAEQSLILLTYQECELAYKKRDFYRLLGFTTELVTDEMINRRARKLLLHYHPDKNRGASPEQLSEQAQQITWIQEARDTLLCKETLLYSLRPQYWDKCRHHRLDLLKRLENITELVEQTKRAEAGAQESEARAEKIKAERIALEKKNAKLREQLAAAQQKHKKENSSRPHQSSITMFSSSQPATSQPNLNASSSLANPHVATKKEELPSLLAAHIKEKEIENKRATAYAPPAP